MAEEKTLISLNQIKFGEEMKANIDEIMSRFALLSPSSYRLKTEKIMEYDLSPFLLERINALTYDDSELITQIFNLYTTKADKTSLNNYRLVNTKIDFGDLTTELSNKVNETYDPTNLEASVEFLNSQLTTFRLLSEPIVLDDFSQDLINYLDNLNMSGEEIIEAINNSTDLINDVNLSASVNTAITQTHAHDNKELLDGLDNIIEGIEEAISQVHTHDNKELLDELVDPLEKSGGEMSGSLIASYGEDPAIKQVRNIIVSTQEPTLEDGEDGDIWIVYTELPTV